MDGGVHSEAGVPPAVSYVAADLPRADAVPNAAQEMAFTSAARRRIRGHLPRIRRRPETIAAVAVQEDVRIVGLSIVSGSHVALTRRVAAALRAAGAHDVLLVVGGAIPNRDTPLLEEAGAAAVYPTGTPLETLVESIRTLAQTPL